MSLRGNKGIGIPSVLCHEAEALVVTIETKAGYVYRGTVETTEDSMNMSLKQVTSTDPDGNKASLDRVFLRGSQILFVIFPDILAKAPYFKRLSDASKGVKRASGLGRGRMMAIGARSECTRASVAPAPAGCFPFVSSCVVAQHRWSLARPMGCSLFFCSCTSTRRGRRRRVAGGTAGWRHDAANGRHGPARTNGPAARHDDGTTTRHDDGRPWHGTTTRDDDGRPARPAAGHDDGRRATTRAWLRTGRSSGGHWRRGRRWSGGWCGPWRCGARCGDDAASVGAVAA